MRNTILPPAPEDGARDTIPAPPPFEPDDCYDCDACDCDGACGARDDRPSSPWADWARGTVRRALAGQRLPSGAEVSSQLLFYIERTATADGYGPDLALAALVAAAVLDARDSGHEPTLAVRAGLTLLSRREVVS